MLSAGDTVFLELSGQPEDSIRQPSTALELIGNRLTVEVKHSAWVLEPEEEILIYFDSRFAFLKQRARIEAVQVTEGDEGALDRVVVELERLDQPRPADRRQSRRASTGRREVNVSLGSGDACPILDVSDTGFSVVSRRSYRRGSTLTATVNCEDVRARGRVFVQNVRPWGTGRVRYGLRCVDSELGEALQQLTMAGR